MAPSTSPGHCFVWGHVESLSELELGQQGQSWGWGAATCVAGGEGSRSERWRAPLEGGLGPLTPSGRENYGRKAAGASFSNPLSSRAQQVMPVGGVGQAGSPNPSGSPEWLHSQICQLF